MTTMPALEPVHLLPPQVGPTARRLRDVPALGWLMAREFSRPGREAEPNTPAPNRWLAAGMLPVFVVVALDAGVYHWDRAAVLTVHRTGLRLIGHRLALVSILAVTLVALAGIADAFGAIWYAAGVVAAVLAYLFYALWASNRAAVEHARVKAADSPVVASATRVEASTSKRATWDVSMAAATPGMDAIPRLYGPLIRDLVPSGCTVKATARNDYLATRYALEGFRFRAGSGKTMFKTMP